jgi:hypothetical protein
MQRCLRFSNLKGLIVIDHLIFSLSSTLKSEDAKAPSATYPIFFSVSTFWNLLAEILSNFFETCLKVKTDINWIFLTSFSTYLGLQNLPLDGAKGGHFFLLSKVM